MKIEKINDNQIRCTLNQQDLQSREIKISELAYGTQKAKDLFHDMIEQADHEFGFHTDDMPLMIEAIPISMDCIVLVITKVEDPEELDTRFSRFAPSEDDGSSTMDGSDSSDNLFGEKAELEGLDGELTAPAADAENAPAAPAGNFVPFSEMLRDATARIAPEIKDFIDTLCSNLTGTTSNNSKESDIDEFSEVDSAESVTDAEESVEYTYEDELVEEEEPVAERTPVEKVSAPAPSEEKKTPAEVLTRLFSFDSWKDASFAASHIHADYDGDALFYKDETQNRYYLLLTGNSEDKLRFFAVSNELTEYAHKVKQNFSTDAYLTEHCKLIIRTDAIRILTEY